MSDDARFLDVARSDQPLRLGIASVGDLEVASALIQDCVGLAGEISSRRPPTPVMLISGYEQSIDPEVVRVAGIRDILRRPLVAHQVAKRIRRLIEPA